MKMLIPAFIEFIPSHQNTIQDNLARFKKLELACFPLQKNSKKPAIPWKNITLNTCDYDSITGNYGVKLDECFIIVDIDPRNGGFESFKKLLDMLGGILPAGFAVQTAGGGYHLYYRRPPGISIHKNLPELPGIDFLSKGQYVVGPGSVINNKPYVKGVMGTCLDI